MVAFTPPFASAPHTAIYEERGAQFRTAGSFYKRESIFSRDLATLSSVIYKRNVGQLHVLDLMAGSGVRGVRYIEHAAADTVHCNDISQRLHDTQVANLGRAVNSRWGEGSGGSLGRGAALSPPSKIEAVANSVPLIHGEFTTWQDPRENNSIKCTLSHLEATKLLMWMNLSNIYPDLIDADGFGATGLKSIISNSLATVKWGGLLCLACTAGPLASGRDPSSGWSLLGSQLRNVPYANEQGLRALLGLAASEAMARKLRIQPLWSLYSPHGPVYRCMIQVLPCSSAQQAQQDLGYVVHNAASGQSMAATWDELLPGSGHAVHEMMTSTSKENIFNNDKAIITNNQPFQDSSSEAESSTSSIKSSSSFSITASGPLWIGPLHNAAHLEEIRTEAAARGWLNDLSKPETTTTTQQKQGETGKGNDNKKEQYHHPVQVNTKKGKVIWSLDELLTLLQEESDPDFPPWHHDLGDIGKWSIGLRGPPAREKLLEELRGRGFKAGRCHIKANAIKTNAGLEEMIRAARVVSGLDT